MAPVVDVAPSPSVGDAVRDLRRARHRGRLLLAALTLGAGAVMVAALAIGPTSVPVADVLAVLRAHLAGHPASPDITGPVDAIVWRARLPRVLTAAFAGAALAAFGATAQALARTALADPYLLGVNAGASTGAAAVTLGGAVAAPIAFSGGALVGALGSILLVGTLAGLSNRAGPMRIILAGLAVGYAFNAFTSAIVFFADSAEAARSVLFWMLGSLAALDPALVPVTAATAILGVGALTMLGPRIDALAAGDDVALAVGLNPTRQRLLVLVIGTTMVGIVVSVVGGVGFVGLVVPQLARRLVAARHRITVPVAAVLGAGFLVAADTVARTAMAPTEIRVGVVAGIVGAPVLLFLLRERSAPTRTL